MGTKIGCDNLVYAIMTSEDTYDEAPVYGSVKSAPGVMAISINPNASLSTIFTGSSPFEDSATLGGIEVEIQKAQLTTENRADLLGHSIDDNGALVYSDNDVPPWVAIGFRTLKSNGKYRYVWLYKGMFTEPEDVNETRGDSINWQADTIKGQFIKVVKQYSVGQKIVSPWKYELDEEHAHKHNAVVGWFNRVIMPNTYFEADEDGDFEPNLNPSAPEVSLYGEAYYETEGEYIIPPLYDSNKDGIYSAMDMYVFGSWIAGPLKLGGTSAIEEVTPAGYVYDYNQDNCATLSCGDTTAWIGHYILGPYDTDMGYESAGFSFDPEIIVWDVQGDPSLEAKLIGVHESHGANGDPSTWEWQEIASYSSQDGTIIRTVVQDRKFFRALGVIAKNNKGCTPINFSTLRIEGSNCGIKLLFSEY